MILVEIPSKTYKLNEDILMKKTKLKEPITIIGESPINVSDSLNGYPLAITSLYGNTSQNGTPTSTEPVPIKVVTGDATVNVLDKNYFLLKTPDYTGQNARGGYGGHGGYVISNNTINFVQRYGAVAWEFDNLKIGETYTFSAKIYNTGSTATLHMGVNNYSGSSESNAGQTGKSATKNQVVAISHTFVATKQNRLSISTGTVDGINATFSDIQLEQGSTSTDYEPYQGQTKPLSLGDKELAGIGDYKDKLFKAVDGNKVYDSLTTEQKAGLTVGSWYKYKMIGKVEINGTETWNMPNSSSYPHLFQVNDIDLDIVNENNNAICNYFVWKTSSQVTSNDGFSLFFVSSTKYLRMTNSDYTTANDFENWLSIAKPIIYYKLMNPVFEEITDTTLLEQLDALHEFVTYKNVTNIFTVTDNEKPELEINYYNSSCVDIVSEIVDSIDGYIDNKEAMKQAIYHILRTERYDYLIYSNNYGVELRQYIGESFEYLRNTIEQTLRDALTYDLRVKDVVVNKVEQKDSDKAVVNFTAYTIYGDLQLEVSVVV